MITGKDVARFVSQVTGDNYVGLYDAAEENDNKMKNEAKAKFNSFMKRLDEASKNRIMENID